MYVRQAGSGRVIPLPRLRIPALRAGATNYSVASRKLENRLQSKGCHASFETTWSCLTVVRGKFLRTAGRRLVTAKCPSGGRRQDLRLARNAPAWRRQDRGLGILGGFGTNLAVFDRISTPRFRHLWRQMTGAPAPKVCPRCKHRSKKSTC